MKDFKAKDDQEIKYIDVFSGAGGFSVAIEDVFDDADCVAFCDNDKNAQKTYLKHYPHHLLVEDVTLLKRGEPGLDLHHGEVDLICGGSPCQGLSRINNMGEGLKCPKSRLFFYFINILRDFKPKYFIFENVGSMSPENERIISAILGVEPVMIMSSDCGSPQRRPRYYWMNWDVDLSKLDDLRKNTKPLTRNGVNVHAWSKSRREKDIIEVGKDGSKKVVGKEVWIDERFRSDGICNTLLTSRKNSDSINFFPPESMGSMARKVLDKKDLFSNEIKDEWLLTPEEMEEAHGFPKGWTEGISETQRIRQMGNAVSPSVVRFFMGELKEHIEAGKRPKSSISLLSDIEFQKLKKKLFGKDQELMDIASEMEVSCG